MADPPRKKLTDQSRTEAFDPTLDDPNDRSAPSAPPKPAPAPAPKLAPRPDVAKRPIDRPHFGQYSAPFEREREFRGGVPTADLIKPEREFQGADDTFRHRGMAPDFPKGGYPSREQAPMREPLTTREYSQGGRVQKYGSDTVVSCKTKHS